MSTLKKTNLNKLKALPQEPGFKSLGPVLKWAGGKSQLLNTFANYFPEKFNRYFEPFAGGAAVFFHLYEKGKIKEAFLNDLNEELINCYKVIAEDCESLILDLKKHCNSADYFYEIRALNPENLSDLERASRFIYLNKTCFNGLYRVNSKGIFNVPYGKYSRPKYCDEVKLRACSNALVKVSLSSSSFENLLKQAKRGDFIYIDPPYQPLTNTSNFTSYTKTCFSENDQIKLAKIVSALDKKGCLFMLSNSDCSLIHSLYQNFRIERVKALRAINCKSEKRGKISELLILNY